MKFLKADGTLDEGQPLTDEQAKEMQRVKTVVHTLICRHAVHYDWQPEPACTKVAKNITAGVTLIGALEDLIPKPAPPAPEPVPVVAAEKDELPF